MASGRQPSAPRSTGSGSNTGGNGTGSGVGLTHLNTLLGLQRRAQDLMACLHPDNLPFLADLLTTCVLQVRLAGLQADTEGTRQKAKPQCMGQDWSIHGSSQVFCVCMCIGVCVCVLYVRRRLQRARQ